MRTNIQRIFKIYTGKIVDEIELSSIITVSVSISLAQQSQLEKYQKGLLSRTGQMVF
jgi:hypothetical protein